MRRAISCAAMLLVLTVLLTAPMMARDDGRYANSPLKPWFESLHSEYGQCCSDADGYMVADVDWESDKGRYRAHLEGEWVVVPGRRRHYRAEQDRPHHGVEALYRRPSAGALLHAGQHDVE